MRRFLRAFAIGLLIGGLMGLWLGINIGRDQPLLSNPLATAADVPSTAIAERRYTG